MKKTVSQIIYDSISKKVSTAYIFSGGSIMHLINHFHPKNNYNNIKYYVPSSEQSSSFASIGHNKSLNKLDSVVITTSGPGITNSLTGLCDAYYDGVPFLLISGDVSTTSKGKHSFQECPSIELTQSITHWNHSITDSSEVEEVMNHAYYLTKNNKTVHINIPKDILSSLSSIEINNNKFNENIIKPNMISINLHVKYVASIINNSNKCVLYVGKGCNEAYKELLLLATKANIPVTTTLHGLGCFDESNKLSLKMIGMHGSERSNNCIQNANVIICIGARFDDRTTGNISKYAPNAKHIIHVNSDLSCFNKVLKNTYNIHAYSKDFLNLLLPLIKDKNDNTQNKQWIDFLTKYTLSFTFIKHRLKQQHIIIILDKLLEKKKIKENLYITTGVGNHQMYTAQLITHKYPNRFITSGSLGTMGYSNSSAIGAKIANPDKIILSIDGDQSFNMLNDLKMIMNYNIAIKIIIMNDSKQSMVNVWEKLFFDNNIVATESTNPNYELLSNAFNIKCITLHENMNYDEIYKCINYFLDYDLKKSIILNCIVESDFCLPLVPPGNALDNMITRNNINKYKIDKSVAPS